MLLIKIAFIKFFFGITCCKILKNQLTKYIQEKIGEVKQGPHLFLHCLKVMC